MFPAAETNMRIYRKRILTIGAGVIAFVLVLLVLSRIFLPKDNTQEAGMEETFANGVLGEKENTIDVLVLGDSYSYLATIPPEIWKAEGYTTYAAGTNDQSLDYTMEMLRRVYRRQNPKVVFIESDTIFREVSLLEGALDYVSTWLPVFRYHDRWKNLRKEDLCSKPEYTLTKIYKGYKYYTLCKPVEDLEKELEKMQKTYRAEKVPPYCVQYIRRIKRFCDDHGAVLFFVTMPNVKYWDYSHHNGIQALADEIGCDYVDMNVINDQIGIDWNKDTCDGGDHLNHAGAVKSTCFLAEYLSGLGVLEDHRGDPDYKQWDESLEKYEKQVKREGA